MLFSLLLPLPFLRLPRRLRELGKHGYTTVSTVLPKSIGFFIINIFLAIKMLSKLKSGNVVHYNRDLMHQSIPPAPSPTPGLLRGIFPPCQSRGWGICKFCTARGPGICQPPGHSRIFDTHAVSYQNITTQKVLLEKKQIGSSVKDRNKS